MNFSELAEARRSVRSFTNQSVSDESITKLLNAARYAPSAGNCQPWHFYVVRDKEIIGGMCGNVFSGQWICSAPVMIVVCLDADELAGIYGERGRTLYCIQDTAASIQNILLCAKDLGLGACWVGAFNEAKCTKALKLPQNHRPIALLPIGYPGSEPVQTYRKPLKDIVTFIGNSEDTEITQPEVKRPVFEHCDMGGTVFEDVNLGNSSFNNINLQAVSITDANLSEGVIKYCNLKNFKITDCIIDGMTINGRNVSGLFIEET